MSGIEEALSRLGTKLAGPGAKVENLVRLSGGASMETWAFSLAGPSGKQDLILRRRPGSVAAERGEDEPGNPLWVEAALIKAAGADGAPVPPVPHVCVTEDGLGEAYVMGRIEGETLGRKINFDARFDAVRPKLARQCGATLAKIHRVTPPAGAPLGVSTALEELDKYEERYRISGARRPIIELAFRHLRERAPPPVEPVLVHGDFRNGTLMFHPDTGVAAVLDWELAHLGDPAEDLAWLCTGAWRFGRPDRPVGGFGDYADLLDGYAEAGGQPMTLERVLYWQAIGSLKWGVMCLGMYMSWVAGGADSSVERAMIGRRVSENEIDLVNILERGL